MDNRPVLFATSKIDADNYCLMNGLKFDDIVWVLSYQLLGSDGLKNASEVHYTELFKTMPAYAEAKFMEAQDKGEVVE